jgi:hypothetical protein
MPNLHLISSMFDSKRYKKIKNEMEYCLDTLFGSNKGRRIKPRFALDFDKPFYGEIWLKIV